MVGTPGFGRLFRRHWDGLSDPRNGSGGAPDRLARGLLFGLPLAGGVLSWVFRVSLADVAGGLIAGYSLAAGVFAAIFTQIAAWRHRLDGRAEAHWKSEAPARRAIDAAAAHALVGVLAAMFALVACVFVELFATGGLVSSALSVAGGIYVVCLYGVIVRSVFVGYESNVDPEVSAEDDRLLRAQEERERLS